jgi:hypothetical protein
MLLGSELPFRRVPNVPDVGHVCEGPLPRHKQRPLFKFAKKHGVSVSKQLTPETLKLLQSILDDAWESLRPYERARTTKTEIASRILKMAASGERDEVRLRLGALSGVITSPL